MKRHTHVLLATCCLLLLTACGNRLTHRSADRSQRLVGEEVAAVGDEQLLTEQDVATSKTRSGARTRSVAASSYKETPARKTKAVAKTETKTAKTPKSGNTKVTETVPVKDEPVVQPTQPTKSHNVVQEIVQGEAKTAENKVIENQPADKPLAQKPVQQPVKPVTPMPVVAVASGPEKVLVEGCVLKQPTSLGAFSVVVGSFAQPESAVNLIKQLGGMGIKPFFVLNEKGLYRLITGTFNDRDEADYQVLKLDVEAIKAWVFIR